MGERDRAREGGRQHEALPPKTIAWDRQQFVVPVCVAIDCLALEVPFGVVYTVLVVVLVVTGRVAIPAATASVVVAVVWSATWATALSSAKDHATK